MADISVKKNCSELLWKAEVLKGLANEYLVCADKTDMQSVMFVGQGLPKHLRSIAKELVELAKKIQ